MKFIVFLSLLCLSVNSVSANEIDSLKLLLTSLPDTEDKLKVLYKLSRTIEKKSSQEALKYVEQQRDLSITLHNQLWLGKAYARIGLLLKRDGFLGDAILNYQKAIDIFYDLNEPLYLADNLLNLGVIHLAAKEYDNALGYFNQSLQIYQQHNDRKLTSATFQNIGLCYAELRNDEAAFYNYNESLEIELDRKDNSAIFKLYTLWGDLFKKRKEYDKARQHFLEATRFKSLGEEEKQEAIAFNNVGETYLNEKNYTEAEKWFNRSLSIKRTVNDKRSLILTLNNMATLKYKKGKDSEAIQYFEEALLLTTKGIIYPESGTHSSYLDSALQRNLSTEKLSFAEKERYFDIYSKSLRFQSEQTTLLANLKDELETLMVKNLLKVNLEIPQLNKQVKAKEKENQLTQILAGLLVICLVALAYFFWENRKDLRKKKAIITGVSLKIAELKKK